jgi:hypothetical protein
MPLEALFSESHVARCRSMYVDVARIPARVVPAAWNPTAGSENPEDSGQGSEYPLQAVRYKSSSQSVSAQTLRTRAWPTEKVTSLPMLWAWRQRVTSSREDCNKKPVAANKSRPRAYLC